MNWFTSGRSIAVCAVALIGLVLGCRQTREDERETEDRSAAASPAERKESRRLAKASRRQLEDAPMRGLLLARRAVRIAPTQRAKESLRQALPLIPHRKFIPDAVALANGDPLGPKSFPVLFTLQDDGTLQVSNVDGTDLRPLEELGTYGHVIWSETGDEFAVVSSGDKGLRATLHNRDFEVLASVKYPGATEAHFGVLGPQGERLGAMLVSRNGLQPFLTSFEGSPTTEKSERIFDIGPDGLRAVQTLDDATIVLEVRSDGGDILHTLEAEVPVHGAEFGPEGSVLWLAHGDRGIRLDLNTGDTEVVVEATFDGKEKEGVIHLGSSLTYEQVELTADGDAVFFDRNDRSAQIYDIDESTVARVGRAHAPKRGDYFDHFRTPADVGPDARYVLIDTREALKLHDRSNESTLQIEPPWEFRRARLASRSRAVVIERVDGGVYWRPIRNVFERGPRELEEAKPRELLQWADDRANRELTEDERESFDVPEP